MSLVPFHRFRLYPQPVLENENEGPSSAGGQVISAIVGCTMRLVLKDVIYVGSALGMALALSAMQATKTLHPPGTDSLQCQNLISISQSCR